ncbi:D-amino-acid transaminase [Marinicrinis sediminis]|uniref:D-alanine aminotransferase n=1 Tax=Marinicrinis sediminis TaxID=1652465 RepID=A0ABW5R699_9BACL
MLLFNGAFVNEKSVSISYQDRGFHFGDGVYEVFRVYDHQVYEMEAHLQRLEQSAKAIQLSLPYSLKQLDGMVDRLIRFNRLQNGTVYLQVTRGAAPRNHPFPSPQPKPTLLGFTSRLERPLEKLKKGVQAITVPDIRWLRCDIKSLNLLPNTMAKQQAKEQEAEEAIQHRDGIVTECSASNIMMIQNGTLRTHPANHLILPGITRAVALRLAQELNIPVSETAFTLEEMMQADEVFLTGTTVEIMPVTHIDGKPIRDGKTGPQTQLLQQAFEKNLP